MLADIKIEWYILYPKLVLKFLEIIKFSKKNHKTFTYVYMYIIWSEEIK